MKFRHGDGENAARRVLHGLGARHDRGERVGHEQILVALAHQPLDDLLHLRGAGRAPDERVLAGEEDGCPVGAAHAEQLVGVPGEAVDEALLDRHVGEKLRLHGLELDPVAGLTRGFLGGDVHGEDLSEEVAGAPHGRRDLPRCFVVAGDQAP